MQQHRRMVPTRDELIRRAAMIVTPKDESKLSGASNGGGRFFDQGISGDASATIAYHQGDFPFMPTATGYDSASGTATVVRYDQWAGATDDRIEEDAVLSVGDVGLVLGRSEREMIAERMEEAIESARGILAWGDDWDGEGSPGYAEATLERARRFLLHGADLVWDTRRFSLIAPKVTAGPEGSIDLHWRDPDRRMLLNVPNDATEAMTFYGRDGNVEIKGQIPHGEDTTYFFAWLARSQ